MISLKSLVVIPDVARVVCLRCGREAKPLEGKRSTDPCSQEHMVFCFREPSNSIFNQTPGEGS